jgi:outer membrane lipoprotein SlyB
MRKTFALLAAAGALIGLSACGHTTEQKTASGAVAGAVVGGPVGAAVGGAAGNVVGHATDGKR